MSAPGRHVLRDLLLVVLGPVLLAAAGLAHPSGLRPSTAAMWTHAHIWLIPVWPLLALGLIVPLSGRPRLRVPRGAPGRGGAAVGLATVVAWAGAFGYATCYTGLDAVAGIGAGTAEQHGGAHPRTVVNPLFHIGGALGHAGVWCLAVGVLAASVALFLRHGARALPGAVVLLACCWSFYDSHIFPPRGVVTMLGFALGFALFVGAAARPAPPAAG